MITKTDPILEALESFRRRAMASWPVRRLLAKWDRTIEVRVPERSYFLRSRAGQILAPALGADAKPEIVLSAAADVMRGVFEGTLNPARAHLDGRLVAEGSTGDQLVLDAIVLLIWGL
jgi:hypothetical protein